MISTTQLDEIECCDVTRRSTYGYSRPNISLVMSQIGKA